MSKTEVKRLLNSMSKDEVVGMVMEMYCARREAKEYLDYFASPDEAGMLQKCKKIIDKEFGDDERSKCRFSVCRKAIADFKKLHPDEEVLADLLVYYMERVNQFSFENGDLWEQFYDSAVSNFNTMMRYLVKNGLLDKYLPRVKQIIAWTTPCGYGYHGEVVDIFLEYAPHLHGIIEDAKVLGNAQYMVLHPYLQRE